MSCLHERLGRRTLLGLLGVGLAATMTASSARRADQGPSSATSMRSPHPGSAAAPSRGAPPSQTAPSSPGCPHVTTGPSTTTRPTTTRPPFPAQPPSASNAAPQDSIEQPAPPETGGAAQVLRHGPENTRQIALTVDDGNCTECVAGYVEFAQRTGIHLTFSPNGIYTDMWAPHARVLRRLIERGQLQIINHTFNHPDLTRLSRARIHEELERNEKWVVDTFGVSTRPYYRPPFGFHSPRVDSIAAEVGMDRVVLWNGSFSDSKLITPQFLMEQAHRYLQPGVIMLGHANHPTVLGLFDEITQLICARQLEPVTLDEMFGSHRPPIPRRTRIRQVPIVHGNPRRPGSGGRQRSGWIWASPR